ncbi:MAG: hypothetical protein RML15_05540 [Bacteroidota bacterium]|nr:hypothetical protein [Candidatus Kapabacteria bacterium]MCS7302860.1 hypothetical protein [Candidatus Kapabacteria bacterium]MCX7937163.1 hypothetical protein [Chlorobiota bacterium]MDW8075240.1 hypothetical protein [Bacteroidota bacterium]MDW8271853.1 hypothetical protein [Bacteroidota bacterium]
MKSALLRCCSWWIGTLASVPLAAQVQTNFFLLDSLAQRSVAAFVAMFSCDSVVVVPPTSAAHWLIVEKLLAHGIPVRPIAPCTLAIADCAVRYGLHPSSRDSLQRTVTVELRTMALDTTQRIRFVHQDVLARSDVAAAELPRSDLTTSPVPPPPRSLWDDILEPVIIVASVATTLLLLFTVRSR